MIILACKVCGNIDLKDGICCPKCARELRLYEVHFVLMTKKELKERLDDEDKKPIHSTTQEHPAV